MKNTAFNFTMMAFSFGIMILMMFPE